MSFLNSVWGNIAPHVQAATEASSAYLYPATEPQTKATPECAKDDATNGEHADSQNENATSDPSQNNEASGDTNSNNEHIHSDNNQKSYEDQLNKGVDVAYDYGKKLGGFLYTFASSASQQVMTHAPKLVEGTVLDEFNQERDKFQQEQQKSGGAKKGAGGDSLPWSGFEEEEEIRRQVLALSSDERNFIRDPPQGIDFSFDLNQNYSSAVALLEVDKNLQSMRYALVPKKLKEDAFWRNYFYRVTLITQSANLKSSSASSGKDEDGAARTEGGTSNKERVFSNSSVDTNAQAVDEFVSDSFADEEQFEQMRKEIEHLEMDKQTELENHGDDDDLDEIEKELLEDLDNTDFEVVNKNGGDSVNTDSNVSKAKEGSGVDDTATADWENEIEQMLEDEVAASASSTST